MEIILYDEGIARELDIEAIAQYLTQKMGGLELR